MNSTTDTHAALLQAVLDDPLDTLSKSALADWYEEQGELIKAEFWRLVAKKGYRPHHYMKCYVWWDYEIHKGVSTSEGNLHSHSMLPPTLHRGAYGHYGSLIYDFHGEAWKAAEKAFCTLTPQQRQECWEWRP